MPANRFHEETSPNYIPKHLNRHPSFYISNLAPLSQSLKISCKAISPFQGKQLLKYLNVNCQLKKGLFCKIETRVSQHIKRKRKGGSNHQKRGRAEGGSSQQRINTNSLLYKPKNHALFNLQKQLFNSYARLSSFLGCKDAKTFGFQEP